MDDRFPAPNAVFKLTLISVLLISCIPTWRHVNLYLLAMHALLVAAAWYLSRESRDERWFFAAFGAVLASLQGQYRAAACFVPGIIVLSLLSYPPRPREREAVVRRPIGLILSMLGGFLIVILARGFLSFFLMRTAGQTWNFFDEWRGLDFRLRGALSFWILATLATAIAILYLVEMVKRTTARAIVSSAYSAVALFTLLYTWRGFHFTTTFVVLACFSMYVALRLRVEDNPNLLQPWFPSWRAPMTPSVAAGGIKWTSSLAFVVGLAFLAYMSLKLVASVPLGYPNGGPDEPMHASISSYIAENLAWPHWDSEELERYHNGTSYASGSSLGYWLEGILLRTTGRSRLSSSALFIVYLSVITFAFRKNPTLGLIGLAAVVPQILFVFSYVNSDAWTAIVALFLGLAVARFRSEPTKASNVYFLLIAAGACMSCRFHMWPIGLLGLGYALLPQMRNLLRTQRRDFLRALALGVAVALWWPMTSYFANDGDIVGMATSKRAVATFAQPDSHSTAKSLDEFDLPQFSKAAGMSFYGMWGWTRVLLDDQFYLLALLTGLPLMAVIWFQVPRLFGPFAVLLLVNFLLMVFYSVQYDYQWQGRYLFPAYFLILGVVLADEKLRLRLQSISTEARWTLTACLIGFGVLNAVGAVKLHERLTWAETIPLANLDVSLDDPTERWPARQTFRIALKRNPQDLNAMTGLAYIHILDQNYSEAESLMEKVFEIEKDNFRALTTRGILYKQRGEFVAAVADFEKALEIRPKSARTHVNLARTYAKAGFFDVAIIHSEKAFELSPADALAERVNEKVNIDYRRFLIQLIKKRKARLKQEKKTPEKASQSGGA